MTPSILSALVELNEVKQTPLNSNFTMDFFSQISTVPLISILQGL